MKLSDRRREALELSELVDKALNTRDIMAISKVITLIEEDPSKLREYFGRLFTGNPSCFVIGITGAPGVGKSSLINHMVKVLRRKGFSVAIVAVDPSSPYSGGSFLGNRVRVRTLDENTFFRSMSTPPEESLPWKAVLAMEFLCTVGFDYVLIEHPGAGQVNVKIMNLVDAVVVVLQPLTGDDIQVLKAGIMEIGDIYVINKCDLPQADLFAMQLRLALEDVKRNGWIPPIVKTNGINGDGIERLVDAINEFLNYAKNTGLLDIRRRRRREIETVEIAKTLLKELYDHYLSVPEARHVL
ncbi:MAG: methylmalonyl Co-A mutase-associated GTPase MeaB, partial [Thaumarchaeota archaeon]